MVRSYLLVFILLISGIALSLQTCTYSQTTTGIAVTCERLIVTKYDTIFNIYSVNVQNITFVHSTINVIPNRYFEQYPETERIFLNKSVVNVIGTTPFIGLHKLEELYLQDNSLTNLAQDAFTDLTALHVLDLHNNQISSMDDNVFSGLVQLDLYVTSRPLSIDLSNNKLTYINDEYFKNLNQLDILELQCNLIANISVKAFRDLDDMRKLNLSSNQLEHLENGLFSALERLVFLDLSKNKLIAFDVNNLNPNARYVFINDNMLTYLDIPYLDERLTRRKSQYTMYLSMNNNRWNCSWLEKAVQLFDKYKINITHANSFNVNNINGINCIGNKTIVLPITNILPTQYDENDKFYKLFKSISDAIN